jgi:hypothetical protein
MAALLHRGALLLAVLAGAARADDDLGARFDHPRRESFERKGAWAATVAEEISKRYGVPFAHLGPAGERADFAVNDATFFEALDRLAATYGLSVVGVPGPEERRQFGQAGLAVLAPDPPLPPTPVAYAGPSRLSVQGVAVLRVRQCAAADPVDEEFVWPFMDDDRQPHACVQLRWLTEPGFEEAAIVEILQGSAADDRGRPLEITEPAGDLPVNGNSDFALRLALPAREAKAIAKLEGRMRIVLPIEQGRVEFAAKEAGATKALGGGSITLIAAANKNVSFTLVGAPCRGMQPSERGFDVRVGSEDWVQRGARTITLLAYDAEGREIGRGGGMSSSSALFGAAWTFEIELDAVPDRMTFESVTRVITREFPFAFKDIPLPD